MAKVVSTPAPKDPVLTRGTPSGGTVSMPASAWDRYYENQAATRTIDSPATYARDGSYIPSGKEVQDARIQTVRDNIQAINKWKQQDAILKGQQDAQINFPSGMGMPVNMFGQPIDSFRVKVDPETGRPPAPEIKPLPTFDMSPGYYKDGKAMAPTGWSNVNLDPAYPSMPTSINPTDYWKPQSYGKEEFNTLLKAEEKETGRTIPNPWAPPAATPASTSMLSPRDFDAARIAANNNEQENEPMFLRRNFGMYA